MKYLAAIFVMLSAPALAQAPAASAVRTVYDADTLRDLPTTDNLFALLETAEPSVNSDRFSEAGLYVGQPARVGSFFSSWTQTLFRLGDADLSDPGGSGAPLLLPDLNLWQRVSVFTGLMPIDVGAPGLAVLLEPRRPGERWVRSAAVSQFASRTAPQAGPPPIVGPDGWTRVSALASGPLLADAQGTTRLGGIFAGSWTRGAQFHRAEASAAEASAASGFAQLNFTPGAHHELQTIGWVQESTYPSDSRVLFGGQAAAADDSAAHLQASWERHPPAARRIRLFTNYTRRERTPDYAASPSVVFERLRDGPPSELAFLAPSVIARWSAGVRLLPAVAPASGTHTLDAGFEFGGSRSRSSSFFSGLAGELVDGIPARIWRVTSPGVDSVRRQTTFSAYLADHIELAPRLTLDLGVRFDSVSGSAEGAAQGVRWRSLLPRAAVQWTMATARTTTAFVGVRRSANRLPLDLLAIGDPAAPTADIFQWIPSGNTGPPPASSIGTLIARTGPGTGGDPELSRIDPDLNRPVTDEFAIGLESQVSSRLRLRVVGFARRERDSLGLVNVGVPLSAYSVFHVPDVNADLVGPDDDHLLPIYNRLPSSFGQDRYLLTNPDRGDATSQSLEISGELKTRRLTLFGGATASRANGPAANRGYLPIENDQSLAGEIFTNPNAETFATGRLFTDRAYTIKLSAIYRFPANVRLGMIARYQDGQPFSRLTVLPGLNQGAEAVRSFPNGGNRFMFTETVDLRLQKGFGPDGQRVALILEAFNVLNTSNEVEERIVTGPDYRTITAIQPPRTFHFGLRVGF